MLQPSWDSISKGTLSSPSTINSSDHHDRFVGSVAAPHRLLTLVFALQMIIAALCHALLPLVQRVCPVAPMEHAPSFYHYPNQIAVPIFLASPEKRISTSY
ncbi:hypothetical protein MRX96_023845 [Rhipicephalus microplus]